MEQFEYEAECQKEQDRPPAEAEVTFRVAQGSGRIGQRSFQCQKFVAYISEGDVRLVRCENKGIRGICKGEAT